ncbi:hypothetical protein L3Q65_18160 [Amycolatopsis sp. FU40]|uniref:hypothetical protein n=1 Tax=Amycolatopsis sp. FU40 TaxID=2914159 RepID=UPI001F1DAD2A|nr:hypothetical protein [Amycolatopsis sp. FU40]UKD58562.1 hypothetical protein L3Q65_18160 [Amycolatopsis sp. FU40]
MTAILSVPKAALAELVHTVTWMFKGKDPRDQLIDALRAARLVPAVFVPGIEHQAATAIVTVGLPGVVYRKWSPHRKLDEHLFLDVDAWSGVRVAACWDSRAHRVRMRVAEVGAPDLWDRIVALFTEWEVAGCPVPSSAGAASRHPRSSSCPAR